MRRRLVPRPDSRDQVARLSHQENASLGMSSTSMPICRAATGDQVEGAIKSVRTARAES